MKSTCTKSVLLLCAVPLVGSPRNSLAQSQQSAAVVSSAALHSGCPAATPPQHSLTGPKAVTLGTYAQFTSAAATGNSPRLWAVNGVIGGDAIVGKISAAGLYSAPLAMPACSTLVVSAFDPTHPLGWQTLPITLQTSPSGPAPIPTVVSTDPMGIVTQNPLVIGRDGTWSALINGKSYWSFNDTAMRAYNAEGQNFISNTRAWTDNLNASNGIYLNHDHLDSTGVPTEFMPFTAAETAFNNAHGDKSGCSTTTDPICGEAYAIWPGPIIAVPNSKTGEAYEFYALILRGGPISGWIVEGIGIAREENQVFTRPIETPGAEYPTLMWQHSNGTDQPASYSSGGMLQGDMVYMTGCSLPEDFGYSGCAIARVPIADITSSKAWRYYNGTEWVADPSHVVSVFTGGTGGNTLYFNPALNEYMTIFSELYSDEVGFYVAPTPWGPWSATQNLFEGVPSIGANGAQDYVAQPHPEFQEQNGLVQYVSYVQDDTDLGFVGQNVQLVRVTFAR